MNLLHRLYLEEDGQGLVEYTLVVLLVALVFWMGVEIPMLEIVCHKAGPGCLIA